MRTAGRWLALSALAYALFHHVGSLPEGLGETHARTRWADWVDLATPYAVLLPAAVFLHRTGVSARGWLAFAVGALAYAQGHGIHLAANSVYNVAPGETAHFWDEAAGHYVWYAGVALCGAVVASCLARLPGRPPLPRHALAHLLAVSVGLTWATNSVGGGTRVAGALVAVAAVAYGVRHRASLASVLVTAFGAALVLLAVEAGTR